MAIRRNPPPGVQKAPRPTTTAPTKASGATTPATTPVADKAPPSDPAAIFVDNREAPPITTWARPDERNLAFGFRVARDEPPPA